MRGILFICLIFSVSGNSTLARSQGVDAASIIFGQSAAFSGPAQALGTGMRDGINAAFNGINSAGGIRGRMLELISYDDSYEPEKAITNTRTLIAKDQVFALIGAVGTPTSKAALPIFQAENIPFIGPFTGAEFLRAPFRRNIINLRASYFQETEALIERLTKDLGHTRIAAFYQNDSYGKAGLAGIEKALAKRDLTLAAQGTYERNTTAVKSALLALRKAAPESVIMIGAYQPCATFIKLAHLVKFNAVFANVSFVGAKALAKELGAQGEGVLISQVVPSPWDTQIPVVRDYQAAMKAYKAQFEPDFISFEGYLAGQLAIEVLLQTPDDPSRENFIQNIYETKRFDLGGLLLDYDESGDNQGMQNIFITRLKADGSFESADRL